MSAALMSSEGMTYMPAAAISSEGLSLCVMRLLVQKVPMSSMPAAPMSPEGMSYVCCRKNFLLYDLCMRQQ